MKQKLNPVIVKNCSNSMMTAQLFIFNIILISLAVVCRSAIYNQVNGIKVTVDGDTYTCDQMKCPEGTALCVISAETLPQDKTKFKHSVGCLSENHQLLREKTKVYNKGESYYSFCSSVSLNVISSCPVKLTEEEKKQHEMDLKKMQEDMERDRKERERDYQKMQKELERDRLQQERDLQRMQEEMERDRIERERDLKRMHEDLERDRLERERDLRQTQADLAKQFDHVGYHNGRFFF